MYLPTPTENIAATQADLKERLRVARQKQDQFHEGMALLELGSLARSCSDPLGAEESFKMALACFNAIQNTNYQGETLNLLAALEQERGNAEAALTYYRRVLVEFGPEAEIPARGVTLLEIGSLIYEYGNVPVARKWFEEALAFFRAHHETVGEIRTRLCLSQVHEAQSNFDAAENEARSAMLLASDHKAFSLACQARSALGALSAYVALGWVSSFSRRR